MHRVRGLVARWQKRHYRRYVKDGYDSLLLRNHTLDPNSTFIEVGGHKGEFASNVWSLYSPVMHIFEPVNSFMQKIELKFSGNEKVILHPYGISEEDEFREFYLDGVSTGAFSDGNATQVQFKNCEEVFLKLPKHIDIMMINIEGGEYELLEILHKTGFINRIEVLLIQFHRNTYLDFIRYQRLRVLLKKNFNCSWRYPFVWEKWVNKHLISKGNRCY